MYYKQQFYSESDLKPNSTTNLINQKHHITTVHVFLKHQKGKRLTEP
jgi:hypothetical protein